jgi:hypothetical protein
LFTADAPFMKIFDEVAISTWPNQRIA